MLVDLLISQSLLEMASFDIKYLLVILLYKLNIYNGSLLLGQTICYSLLPMHQ